MSKEIEHKYLVIDESFRLHQTGETEIIQGYLKSDDRCTVRIRIYGSDAFITVKGHTENNTRDEFEYPIPYEDARFMLDRYCPSVIRKIRHIVYFEGHKWEIDEFKDSLEGLVIAEIELDDQSEEYMLPPFVGKNVSDDPRYYNSNLVKSNGFDK